MSNDGRLALVVQLGFAGSRQLLDVKANPATDVEAFESQVERGLTERLTRLHTELRLGSHHFFCGISAIAIGGDMVFSRACETLKIPQRVFLPQTRDEFLNATGDSGADFPSTSLKEEAVRLLEGPHVIQERVVSEARDRGERFEETNREIVRVSDVLVCLIRGGAIGRPGGTEDLVRYAVLRGKPVLVISVDAVDGKPVLNEQWRLPAIKGKPATDVAEVFQPPQLPRTLEKVALRDANEELSMSRYCEAIKGAASPLAKQLRKQFVRMAIWILATHVIATVIASLAIGIPALHEHREIILLALGLELVMLSIGVAVHQWLHRWHVTHRWAEARLLAQVVRSVQAVGKLHVYLRHLFELPFPKEIRSLLRTINVKHLQNTRRDATPWQAQRDQYLADRLTDGIGAQIPYFLDRIDRYDRLLGKFQLAFIGFWLIAFASTLSKLVFHDLMEHHSNWAGIAGALAIVMPVLAAGALSLAAALDLEAQRHTFEDIEAFLEKQRTHLINATSYGDFRDLVLETETRLLGETATWFSRRSFVSVA